MGRRLYRIQVADRVLKDHRNATAIDFELLKRRHG